MLIVRDLVKDFGGLRAVNRCCLKQMTVLENCMLVPGGQTGERLWASWFRPGRVRRQEAEVRDKALDVLQFVNLTDLKDEYAANLSGGQKKLLEIARAMMADPEMILLDEPGAGVNPTLMNKLVGYIEKLVTERNATVFLIEHDMDLVMTLCNPVIVMSNGEKLAEGTPAEIRKNERVLEAYLGSQYAESRVQR
ncbi:ABC transporter ATP-binding protein [Candidatus Acetothermia bacterium]|nr:ABC transporter ATP-binding protein [Candidatus Acetothermia bacterium]